MKGKKILVAAVISLTVIGLVGGLVSVIKSNKKKNDRDKTLNKNTPQTPNNTEETKNKPEEKIDLTSVKTITVPEGILEAEFETAEQLLKDTLHYLIFNTKYSSPDELLEKVIRLCGQKIDDYSWYAELPKNIDELEDKIDEFGLFELHEYNLIK